MGLTVYITFCMTQIKVHRAHSQPFGDGTPSSKFLCTPRVKIFFYGALPPIESYVDLET